ncbi:hypothetical protein AB0I00_27665 [Streptomyces sp. NPDC050803]|uniref:hypothetical protein n=1 Tax=unclassified Streptomyces TaxID=2593676 RepID=UPI003435D988
MKRRIGKRARIGGTVRISGPRTASAGVFTTATAAALLATCPVNVTVTVAPEPPPANPVCEWA